MEDARVADEVPAAVSRSEDEFIPYEQARKVIPKRRSARR